MRFFAQKLDTVPLQKLLAIFQYLGPELNPVHVEGETELTEGRDWPKTKPCFCWHACLQKQFKQFGWGVGVVG